MTAKKDDPQISQAEERRRRKRAKHTYNDAIVKILRQRREDMKITIKQLSEHTGLSYYVLSRLENAQTLIPVDYLLTLCNALELDVATLPGFHEMLNRTLGWSATVDQLARGDDAAPNVLRYYSGTEQYPERINFHVTPEVLLEQPRLLLHVGGYDLEEVGYPARSLIVFWKQRKLVDGKLVLALHRPSGSVLLRKLDGIQLAPLIPKQLAVVNDASIAILGVHLGTYREER